MSRPIEERILNRVIEDGDCIIFTGPKAGNGYGVIGYQARSMYVHRIVWTLFNGDIPVGKCVLHKCDKPACCNIEHLFIGTHKDNTQDMMHKGRHNPFTKIPTSEFQSVKERIANGETQKAVAAKYNASRSAVHRIISGERS